MEVTHQPTPRSGARLFLAAALVSTVVYRSTAMTISPRHQEFYRVSPPRRGPARTLRAAAAAACRAPRPLARFPTAAHITA